MGFNCGIVGLPNVGKSTLFNALTQTQAAQSANYPFCTVEPNTGRVSVPDTRLDRLAALAGSQKIIPSQLEFVDIAGLAKGASKGEGLGNQFLGNIREVDAICHVLRCFEDADITHVDGSVDPIRDADVVETELMLADMESLERRVATFGRKQRGGDKQAKANMALMERCLQVLGQGNPVRVMQIDEDEKPRLKSMQLLTAKPVLYVCNVEEDSAAGGNQLSAKVAVRAEEQGYASVVISAAIEAEIAQMETEEEKSEFLADFGLQETGLSRVIRAGYQLLDQITFFTVGPKEARAWNVKNGATAPKAAGVIHTDFERGFICAETTTYEDYIKAGSEAAVKEAGKMRLEGKEYRARDGDIFNFRFNV